MNPGHSQLPSVMIVDNHEAAAAYLGSSFRSLGFAASVAADYKSALALCDERCPELIVTELRIGVPWVFEYVERLRAACPASKIAIATGFPSVATAVRAMRAGFDGYFAKPVQAQLLAGTLQDRAADGSPPDNSPGQYWPTLNRTIWEYLNQVLVLAGTMSEAARRLGVDRRSLRRMLARYPPAR